MAEKKAKQAAEYKKFYGMVKGKRMGNKTNNSNHELEYLTVQQVSKEVEGKAQKYSRIGPLTMVKFGRELTIENIKRACEEHVSMFLLERNVIFWLEKEDPRIQN